ncbi:MAG: hypothetical protein KAT34_02155 [Candidatus Aminicenantes bacterium]|nr:hypothetical protein [Candidatus Aminicenantes bacterium]
MPKTKLGKWAGVLLALFLISLLLLNIFLNIISVRRGSVEIIVLGIFMMIAGIATFGTGAVSLFKFKDRSLLVILATIFGFLAFLLFLMELVEFISR